MPKYSYETYSDMRKETSDTNKRERKVGYFKLQPNEKAVVRFAYVEPKEFEIATVHEVKVQDKFRTVVCLRSAKDDISACPLCVQGAPLKARFYAKLLHYVVKEDGTVEVLPEVANWPKKYADVLRARFNEYGDLKDNLFTITRIGTGKDTSYDIQYANPVKYSEANGFVKDFSAFEDFDLAHHSYTERTKEEIEEFLKTGDFPMRKKETTTGVGTIVSPVPTDDEVPVDVKPQANTYTYKSQENVRTLQDVPNIQDVPVSQATPQRGAPVSDITTNRPRRTYDIQ